MLDIAEAKGCYKTPYKGLCVTIEEEVEENIPVL